MASPTLAPTFDPRVVLDDIYSARETSRTVTVKLHRDKLRISQDHLSFTVTSSHAGYVYVLHVGTDLTEFLLLFSEHCG